MARTTPARRALRAITGNGVMAVDVIAEFKAAQRAGWAHFAPLQTFTTEPAARLVRFAGVRPGDRVLVKGSRSAGLERVLA